MSPFDNQTVLVDQALPPAGYDPEHVETLGTPALWSVEAWQRIHLEDCNRQLRRAHDDLVEQRDRLRSALLAIQAGLSHEAIGLPEVRTRWLAYLEQLVTGVTQELPHAG